MDYFTLENYDNLSRVASDAEHAEYVFNLVQNVLNYFHFGYVLVDFVFLYVVASDWTRKDRTLGSTFFILYWLRVLVDVSTRLYFMLSNKWFRVFDLEDALFPDAKYLFNIFCINFDSACHLVMCMNRFTALVYPFRYSQIWNARGNAVSISVLFLTALLLAYPDLLHKVAFNFLRMAVSVVSLLIVVLPVVLRGPSSTSTQSSRQNRQLLYEAILSAGLKLVENGTYIYLNSHAEASPPSTLYSVVKYLSIFVSNVFMTVTIVFLFCISTVARKALLTAVHICRCSRSKLKPTTTSNVTFVSSSK